MANTYTDATGVLLFEGPAHITPVIDMLFSPFRLDDAPEGSAREYHLALASEDNDHDWASYVRQIGLAAEGEIGIALEDCPNPSDSVKALAAYFDAPIEDLLPSIDFDSDVQLSDVVALALLCQDGHNLVGMDLEGCWHCDRTRLGEFGGWATFASNRYFLSLTTSELSAFARAMDAGLADIPAAAAAVLGEFVQKLIGGINDPEQREQVARRLA